MNKLKSKCESWDIMVTLDKYQFGSEEYERELKRENTYFLNMVLGTIADGMYYTDKVTKALYELIKLTEEEIGEKEFTVGISFEK